MNNTNATTTLTIRLPLADKIDLDHLCQQLDITPSQLIRGTVRGMLADAYDKQGIPRPSTPAKPPRKPRKAPTSPDPTPRHTKAYDEGFQACKEGRAKRNRYKADSQERADWLAGYADAGSMALFGKDA